MGAAGAAGLFLIFESHRFTQAINGYYFDRPISPLTAVDAILAVLAVYLLLVAMSGRWRLLP